ncbi:hypothetical protein [Micromonospora sp. CB01531]|uniref:hypothetical protein n=1 Tax=Micromonospora sp. CB01531 TaxID=1718947 RepID=UPI00093CF830|nr:hypothetical protein [Micromonospora sp. CB01531]OKI48982.1 hypothetical protein A6A27_36255 [Micromonospora sp. CB01531]
MISVHDAGTTDEVDPRISAIPLRDNGEALVDLREIGELRVDDRLSDAAGAYAHVRKCALQIM